MMANPETSGAQEQDLGLGAGSGAAVEIAAESGPETGPLMGADPVVGVDPLVGPEPEVSSRRRDLGLLGRVLAADFGVAIVALIALTVIEVQRINETGMHLRRQAYVEDLVVLFAVAAVFGLVTFFLTRAGRTKVAIVQAVITLAVLGVAVTSAATGSPKPITVEQDQ